MRSRLALLLVLVAPCLRADDTVLLERVLAVVNGRPVLLSSVNLFVKVKGLDAKAALEATIDERLMGDEAALLPQATVTEEEEQRGYLSILNKLGGLPDDVAEFDLKAFVHREEVILKYVDFRFRTEVRVSDAEVQKAYDARYGSLPNPPDRAEVEDALRKGIEDSQVNEAVEAWVKELRASAEIRYQKS